MSEITDEIRERRIEEAAEAVASVLNLIYMASPNMKIKKQKLFPKAEEKVYEKRREQGFVVEPTVENRVVREPNISFIKSNWKDICLHCANYLKVYIVWSNEGVRIGTIKEYWKQQGFFSNTASGIASTHNMRSTIINKRGGESVFLDVTILQIPEGDVEEVSDPKGKMSV